jgi:hypothetical protein
MTRKEQVQFQGLLIGVVSLFLFIYGGLTQDWFILLQGIILQVGHWSIYVVRKNYEKEKEISRKVKGKKNSDNKEPHWLTKLLRKFMNWLDN